MERNDVLAHWGIKGMKWGVRRYQNKDGSLTDAGKKRYEREQLENAGKKKGDRVGSADPVRWARQDGERTRDVMREGESMAGKIRNANAEAIRRQRRDARRKTAESMDLSKMTDQELRDKINRANLERQYVDICTPDNVSRGREKVDDTLSIAGSVLGIGASAVTIALGISKLVRGGG